MRKLLLVIILFSFQQLFGQLKPADSIRLENLMKQMTLEEKIGQMNMYTGNIFGDDPVFTADFKYEDLKNGRVGAVLNVNGIKNTKYLQELALQSRLKIPLLFGNDVLHGLHLLFPIPLAEAASWDIGLMEKTARIAAIESSARGNNWFFQPMVDITHDPRWGRVMEGAGEDPYLGSLIAAARVRGYQGNGIGDTTSVMATAKHFAAYGAAIGGRDYNTVDMSNQELWNVYLPPFKAAAEAGASSFMNSFNTLNGVPTTASSYLQRDILKGEWGFRGFVVSDWGSVGDMIAHGYVKDAEGAALAAVTAGCDMDMEDQIYKKYLPKLVAEGKVSMDIIDDAVRRILTKKFELGLFDDPFKFISQERWEKAINNPGHIETARQMGRESIVLLKNEIPEGKTQPVLPLSKNIKTIALIGPHIMSVRENLGFWSPWWPDDSTRIITQYQGIKSKVSANTRLLYAKGCEVSDTSTAGFAEAVRIAKQADVVIMSMGEQFDMSGESRSRSDITFPGVQEALIKAIYATGTPIVMLVNAGRPLVFNWAADHVPAILYTWWLGTTAGGAIADVLFGDYNPSGKLPITFPRSVGQVPIFYNHLSTGKPPKNDSIAYYRTGYIDLMQNPKFAFGHGLSYTTFEYGDFRMSDSTMKTDGSIRVSLSVTNTGKVAGEETVQLYLRDKVGSIARPVKELKDFKKVILKPGEKKRVEFVITPDKLTFYNEQGKQVLEPGEFDVMIGSASDDIRLKGSFLLNDEL
ncbi:MAG: glycoside hydrolase family 3 C-terminal domain-containing protein [Chitinophagaceae bacterium]|nr:glycoside hydrolase family 3 C-terminal domain-containing protein [Chitinophagaceae bacterium]